MDALYEWQETNKLKPKVRLTFREYTALIEAVGKVAQVYDRTPDPLEELIQ